MGKHRVCSEHVVGVGSLWCLRVDPKYPKFRDQKSFPLKCGSHRVPGLEPRAQAKPPQVRRTLCWAVASEIRRCRDGTPMKSYGNEISGPAKVEYFHISQYFQKSTVFFNVFWGTPVWTHPHGIIKIQSYHLGNQRELKPGKPGFPTAIEMLSSNSKLKL